MSLNKTLKVQLQKALKKASLKWSCSIRIRNLSDRVSGNSISDMCLSSGRSSRAGLDVLGQIILPTNQVSKSRRRIISSIVV